MNILPPRIIYNAKYIDNRVTSKARSFYNHVVSSMRMGGLLSITRTKSFNGYVIIVSARKDDNYNNVHGEVIISYSRVIEEDEASLDSPYYVNIDIGYLGPVGSDVKSAIYNDSLLPFFSDREQIVVSEGLWNSYEHVSPSLLEDPDRPPVYNTCISYNVSDSNYIINYAGCQSAYGYQLSLPDPSIGALTVYKGVRFWCVGTFVFDARVKEDKLYVLAGYSGSYGTVRLYIFDVSDEMLLTYPADVNSGTEIFYMSTTGTQVSFSTGESYSMNISGNIFIMCAKLNPDCTHVSLMNSSRRDDPDRGLGNNYIYDILDITLPLQIDLDTGLSSNFYYVSGTHSSAIYPDETYYLEESFETVVTSSNVETQHVYGSWYGTTTSLITSWPTRGMTTWLSEVHPTSGDPIHINNSGELNTSRYIFMGDPGYVLVPSGGYADPDTQVFGSTGAEFFPNPDISEIHKQFGIGSEVYIADDPDPYGGGKNVHLNKYAILTTLNTSVISHSKKLVGSVKIGFRFDDDPNSPTFGQRFWTTNRSIEFEAETLTSVDVDYSRITVQHGYRTPSTVVTPTAPVLGHPEYEGVRSWMQGSLLAPHFTISQNVLSYGKGTSAIFSGNTLVNTVGVVYDDSVIASMDFSMTENWELVGFSWLQTGKTFSYGSETIPSQGKNWYSQYSYNFECATYPERLFGAHHIQEESKSTFEIDDVTNLVVSTSADFFSKSKVVHGSSVEYSNEPSSNNAPSAPYDPYLNVSVPSSSVSRVTNRYHCGLYSNRPGQAFRFELSSNSFVLCTNVFKSSSNYPNMRRNEIWIEDETGSRQTTVDIIQTPTGPLDINNIDHVDYRVIMGAAHLSNKE